MDVDALVFSCNAFCNVKAGSVATSPPSNATPKMLSWAREKAGLAVADVVAAEKIDAVVLEAWEKGEGTPSLAVLRRLGKRYKRPIMVFYLASPPRDFAVVKDFRRLPTTVSKALSSELRHAIRFAQERQAWAADYRSQEGFRRVDFVGTVSVSKSPKKAAKDFRKKIGITISAQSRCDTAIEAFRLWRDACENRGLIVFQTHDVKLSEMRGCALPNDYAPVVLVNAKDADSAKSFTLFHEIGHVLLGHAALTGSGATDNTPVQTRGAERFCNQFAAEVLVPADSFKTHIPVNWPHDDDEVIKNAAAFYGVSRHVILLRLVETGFADDSYLQDKWPRFQPKTMKTPSKNFGPKQHVLSLFRNGPSFSKLALSAYYGGEIHGGQLTGLLNMKLKHLPSFETAVYPSRVQAID